MPQGIAHNDSFPMSERSPKSKDRCITSKCNKTIVPPSGRPMGDKTNEAPSGSHVTLRDQC